MIFYSLYYVALLGFLATVTNMWVIVQRMKLQVPFGDGGDETLIKARAAHHNLLEFGVIFVLMLMAAEFLGMQRDHILLTATVFFCFRLFHIYYMLASWTLPSVVRIIGTAGSHLVNLGLMVFIVSMLFFM